MFVHRYQALDHHHFGAALFHMALIQGHDLFQQDSGVAGGDHVLGISQGERFRRGNVGAGTDDGGRCFWARVSGSRLGNRLEEADVNAMALHRSDHTEADGGDANT